MGTFTVASGLGMLFVGIVAMFVIGSVGLYIINRLPKDEENEDGR
tara:strand:+ start:724 stop:858 length:135 start_codon:yes stop_codon:yes gene_type:complete